MWRDPYSYVLEFVGASALPALGTVQLNLDIDREADFATYRVAALATSLNVRASLIDQAGRVFFSDGALPLNNLFGTGQLPRELPAARVTKRTNQIRVSLTDASGVGNTVRLLFTGSQLFPDPPFVIPKFQWGEPWSIAARFGGELTDDQPALAASGSGEFNIRTPGDSWFEAHALTITRTGAATLQILTNSIREWFRRPIHVDLLGASDLAGNYLGIGAPTLPAGAWGFRFTPAKLLPINTAVTVRVADLSAAANSIRVAIHGVRRYV